MTAYPLYFSPDYVLASHSFDTTRKAGWVADSLAAAPLGGVELRAPEPATFEALCAIHEPAYVEAVRSGVPRALAESQGFAWDPKLWTMVCASSGGAVAAALSALDSGVAGSLSSGLHHARRAQGAGFCTFNGLALAASAALAATARRILILDLDAHCGGGTHSLLGQDERIWQTDVSVSPFDSYVPTARTTLDLVTRSTEYIPTLTRRLAELERAAPPFDLCLYNAGMDPCEGSGIDGLPGVTIDLLAERERLVFDWCRGRKVPICFVLAGGYLGERLDRAGLVALHRLTLTAGTW